MTDYKLPQAGQDLTCIAVYGGEVHLLPAHAETVTPEGVLLALDLAPAETPALAVGAPVTLIYAGAEAILRLKGRISAAPVAGQVEIETAGAPTAGERRDFIRADTEVPLFVDVLQARTTEDAAKEQEAHPVATGDTAWRTQTVDLSGNGAAFPWDRLVSKGDLLDVRLRIPSRRDDGVIATIGRVVRIKPDGDGFHVAVHFEHIDDLDQDRLFSHVASRYYAVVYKRIADATSE